MPFTLGVPLEAAAGERRVALTPEAAKRLLRKGAEVRVERGAGVEAGLPDEAFAEAGCVLVDRAEALACEVVATVQGLAVGDLGLVPPGALVLGLLRPLDVGDAMRAYAGRGLTALAMELVPRTTRAQKMDALSAMSTVAGYKAVLLAADLLPRFFPLLTTAAGTVKPARVLVLGAGVAGLQALATARRLGAVTAAYDVRAAAREQVESVGAAFVDLDLETGDAEDRGGYARALADDEQARQVELLAAHIATADVVIATALIPGRAAPRLITRAGVEAMKPGSVIIDLAAPGGGNCEATVPGETVRVGGVTVAGPLNLASDMPQHASEMYGRTVSALLLDFVGDDGTLRLDLEDEILASAVVTHGGQIVNAHVAGLTEGGQLSAEASESLPEASGPSRGGSQLSAGASQPSPEASRPLLEGSEPSAEGAQASVSPPAPGP